MDFESQDAEELWWSSASVRISHMRLDPETVSTLLKANPQISASPEAKDSNRKEGYWCIQQRFDAPDRVDRSIAWAESFVADREQEFQQLLTEEYQIDVYVGIHTAILATGFELPHTPTLARMGIRIGIEIFCS